jgi:hypothetical protein
LVVWIRQFVSLQEVALWDAGVLDLWLIDLDSVIFEVVVDSALSCSEVFVWVLDDWFNEKGLENELLQNDKVNLKIRN